MPKKNKKTQKTRYFELGWGVRTNTKVKTNGREESTEEEKQHHPSVTYTCLKKKRKTKTKTPVVQSWVRTNTKDNCREESTEEKQQHYLEWETESELKKKSTDHSLHRCCFEHLGTGRCCCGFSIHSCWIFYRLETREWEWEKRELVLVQSESHILSSKKQEACRNTNLAAAAGGMAWIVGGGAWPHSHSQ